MRYLIASSIQKTFALKRNLEQLKKRDYPSDSPRVLTELLLMLCDHVFDRLISLASREGSEPDDVATKEVLVLGRAIAQLARFAEPVARLGVGYVPWGLVYPVETLCRQISPESRVIIHPYWGYNYTYYEALAPLKRIMEGVGTTPSEALFKGYPKYLAVLSFPAMEGLNILQNAAWGHEIGHHLNVVFGIADRVLEHRLLGAADIDAAAAEILRVNTEGKLSLESREEMRVAVLKAAVRLTNNWVTELVADVFSIHVFGPASLFAFSDIVPMLYPLDQPDPDHPPAWLRMAVMLEELDKLGYDELLTKPSARETENPIKKAVSDELARLRMLSEQEPKGRIEPQYYLPALKASQAAVPFITEEIGKVSAGRWACSAQTLAQDVFELVDRLANGVPPCEVDELDSLVGRQTSLAAIVNAGWFYRILCRYERPPQNESEAMERRAQSDQLNELILTAVELSAIRLLLLK